MSRPSAFACAVAGLAWVLLFSSTALTQKPLAEKVEPTYGDVSYGPAARNVLDFYQADGEQPAPLLIHVHGGGFVGGDKRQGLNPYVLRPLKASGIHFASINYRFVNGKDVIFPAPQLDGARAVQFLR